MLRVGSSHVGLGAAGAVLVLAGWLVACEDSSNTPGGGNFGGADFDAGGGNTGIDGGGPTGSNQNDAAPEAGQSSTEPAIALANLHGSAIDFCFIPPGATDWVGPVFGSEGGVPNGGVSVKRPVPIGSKVALIGAGQDCTSTPLFTPGTDPQKGTPRITLVVRGGPDGDARKVFEKPAEHVAGKEMVYYAGYSRDALFTPSGGGVAVEIKRGPTALDPNVTGELTLTPSSGPTFARSMKTAAGVVLLIETSTEALLCDELAPPNGHLLRCGADVRVP
jgi:hypothetical protein